jgi:hypothetical protein
MDMHQKIPKTGTFIMVEVYENDSLQKCMVYLGSVHEAYKKTFVLGGLYENTTPMKGCCQSGRFEPLQQESIKFPRPNVPLRLQRWKKVSDYPSSVGQYFVYVDDAPVPMTVISTTDLTKGTSAKGYLFCAIGGTHAFYATDLADVRAKLEAAELRAFPEFTDAIFKDTISLIGGSLQRRFLQKISTGMHQCDAVKAT